MALADEDRARRVSSGPVFFTDRDLGKKFPEILRAGGLAVERHADHFRPDTSDEVWLRDASGSRWTSPDVPLLTDTKAAEYLTEQIIAAEFPGDFA